MKIIGRKNEIETLTECYESKKSEFVAIYGRRRIGKTFLVKELFGEEFAFYSTGILNGDRNIQLQAFSEGLTRFGGSDLGEPKNWLEAFSKLNSLIEKSNMIKKVIFLDEVPWMSTMHSDFLAGLDYFWNRWASSRKDVLLIICGSAAAWMTDNIINNVGGLHNRLTSQILLKPFSLNECEEYFEDNNIRMSRLQIAEAYMIFGGVPYYLSLLKSKYSLYQNVDRIYFSENAELSNEFENLYRSLFKNSEKYMQVIKALSLKGIGMTQGEIAEKSKIKDGGTLTKILKDLEISGFVRKYMAFGNKKKDALFQLIDFFSMFDLYFRSKREEYKNDYWLRTSSTPSHYAWSGFAFEKLCLLHIPQIRHALGISGVLTGIYSWKSKTYEPGAQIDLVIERSDKVINLCEMKYSSEEYVIDKQYDQNLRNKRGAFIAETHTKCAAHTTMITTYGLKRNMYQAMIPFEVTLDDLFITI